jgi:Flp pilus assembly protein TadG
MYNYMDSNSGPISIFFFCFLVIFGSFFSMQLVLAQIMDSFAREQMKKQNEGLEELKEEKTNEAMMNFLKAAGGNVPAEDALVD